MMLMHRLFMALILTWLCRVGTCTMCSGALLTIGSYGGSIFLFYGFKMLFLSELDDLFLAAGYHMLYHTQAGCDLENAS